MLTFSSRPLPPELPISSRPSSGRPPVWLWSASLDVSGSLDAPVCSFAYAKDNRIQFLSFLGIIFQVVRMSPGQKWPSYDEIAPTPATAAPALLSSLFDSPPPFSMLRSGVSVSAVLAAPRGLLRGRGPFCSYHLDTLKPLPARRVGWITRLACTTPQRPLLRRFTWAI